MEYKPIYGKSPLIAFMEAMERKKIAYEFYTKLNERLFDFTLKPKTIKSEIKQEFIRLIPLSDKSLEWVPFDYTADICRAFNVPIELLNTDKCSIGVDYAKLGSDITIETTFENGQITSIKKHV